MVYMRVMNLIKRAPVSDEQGAYSKTQLDGAGFGFAGLFSASAKLMHAVHAAQMFNSAYGERNIQRSFAVANLTQLMPLEAVSKGVAVRLSDASVLPSPFHATGTGDRS